VNLPAPSEGYASIVAAEQLAGTVEVFVTISTWLPLAGWQCCDWLTRFDYVPDRFAGEGGATAPRVRAQHGPNPEHSAFFALADREAFEVWLRSLRHQYPGQKPREDSSQAEAL